MSDKSFTIRMGLFDTRLWTPQDVVELYGKPLKEAGFTTPQYPSVVWPKFPVKVLQNDPFPGARTLTIQTPFGDLEQTRDLNVPYDTDPAKLAEAGAAFASLFTWNLCSGSDAAKDYAAILRDIFRSIKPVGLMKLSPKVAKWSDAPLALENFPNKPDSPNCEPKTEGEKAKSSPWWYWVIGVGVLGLMTFSGTGQKQKRKEKR